MQRFWQQISILFVFAVSGFLTLLIISNTYEILSGKDFPYTGSILTFTDPTTINNIIQVNQNNQRPREINPNSQPLGEFDSLYLPTTNDRIFITSAKKDNNDWLIRPGNIHFAPLNFTENNLPGDYIFFTQKSWRTIPDPDSLQLGDTIEVYNQSGRIFTFSVIDKKQLSYKELYINPQSPNRQIIILVQDTKNQTNNIFLAE